MSLSITIFQFFRIVTFLFLLSFFSFLSLPSYGLGSMTQPQSHLIKIGVLAWRGEANAHKEWDKTIKALAAGLPEYKIVTKMLNLSDMEKAVKTGSIDFFISNPGNYVDMEQRYAASRLVTLETVNTGKPVAAIGATIFSLAKRHDIRKLADIKGKRMLVVSKKAFGGFEIAWGVLQRAGINPFRDLQELQFSGFPLDKIVMAVKNGQTDIGTVRACLLEGMAKEGKIRLSDFHIINAQSRPDFDCAVSTPLYPNWPFAKTKAVDHALAKKVAIVLLDLKADDVKHWTIALSYQPVENLFRYLQIGPFVQTPQQIMSAFIKKYRGWIAFSVLLLLLGFLHVVRTEHLVRVRTQEVKDSQEKARLRLAELAHVSRQITLGELARGLAHEINQPLGAIANYAAGCVRAIKAGKSTHDLAEPLTEISRQAEHAGRIVKHIRYFVGDNTRQRKAQDMNHIINEASQLLDAEIRKSAIIVKTDFAHSLPSVLADPVAIEQVTVNLIRNAIDAMSENTDFDRILTLSTRLENNSVRVSIKDTGAGLTDQQIEQMFQPFETSKESGMGLGLSISQSIIHNHQGEIWANRNRLRGLCVSFSLPISTD